jgi:hypothetical protein
LFTVIAVPQRVFTRHDATAEPHFAALGRLPERPAGENEADRRFGFAGRKDLFIALIKY